MLLEYTFGNLTVHGTLDVGAYSVGSGTGTVIEARNITIGPGGVIKATARGFQGGRGPGAGTGNLMGGTHGGKGYDNTDALYGSIAEPINVGSGGRTPNSSSVSGAGYGGGAIQLVVLNSLTVDGTVVANGGSHASYGGGAGGSIWLDTGLLAGTGVIQANGGVCNYGGGGGRISITYRNCTMTDVPPPGTYTGEEAISAAVTVKGGYNVGIDGVEDGSIFVREITTGTIFIIR